MFLLDLGRSGTVILDHKDGDAGSVSLGVEKASGLYRERDDLTTSNRLAIDPTTARKVGRGS